MKEDKSAIYTDSNQKACITHRPLDRINLRYHDKVDEVIWHVSAVHYEAVMLRVVRGTSHLSTGRPKILRPESIEIRLWVDLLICS